MLKLLLRPFSYLTIEHPDPIFKWINWYLPCSVAAFSGFLLFLPAAIFQLGYPLPAGADIWGGDGLISKIQGLVQNLPGFYTAALAVISTFGGTEMQKVMPGRPAKMKFVVEGVLTEPLELSRRLFLSAMFAYLTALSFLISILSAILIVFAPAFKPIVPPDLIIWLNLAAIFCYALFFTQMLTITAWGLYYLGEKIHLSDGPST